MQLFLKSQTCRSAHFSNTLSHLTYTRYKKKEKISVANVIELRNMNLTPMRCNMCTTEILVYLYNTACHKTNFSIKNSNVSILSRFLHKQPPHGLQLLIKHLFFNTLFFFIVACFRSNRLGEGFLWSNENLWTKRNKGETNLYGINGNPLSIYI